MRRWQLALVVTSAIGACSSPSSVSSAPPGVVFTYPVDGQVDVPTGANVLVTLSDPVDSTALACKANGSTPTGGFCLIGPNGPVAAMPSVSGDNLTVSYAGLTMDAGASYAIYVGADLAPTAQNLPSGPLAAFTTRSTRPKAAAPMLVAINGGDPANPESFRPMLEATTIELLFSEPLDPRSVVLGAGAFELLDATNTEVPAAIYSDGIHVAIDPTTDLTAGASYTLRVGSQVKDESGQAMTAATATLTPHDSLAGSTPITQMLRTRGSGDPGTASSRLGVTTNTMAVDSPLIGSNSASFETSVLATELGDPNALGGPIAFTIRRGQRLSTTGLTVALGGQVPVGLSTGDIYIELLTDASGRLFRNPHQDPSQSPDNQRAPLYAEMTLDLAVFATDPNGNATLAQTVLGVQAFGVVDATDGVLDIETYAVMDLGLLGVTSAPINLDLELITDASATPATDSTPPTLVATYPAQSEDAAPIDTGVELIFSEPIDLAKLPAGSIKLENGSASVPAVLESHGSVVVLRPASYLARNTQYTVDIANVADVAGNALAATTPIGFHTEDLVNKNNNPLSASAVHPGVACALTGGTAASPGRCSGGGSGDDLYQPFTLPADEPIEVQFTQPPEPASIALGTMCNAGSVRVEQVDATGACVSTVPGTLLVRDRSLSFVPDEPWAVGTTYRFTMISGGNSSCDAGEVCGVTDSDAASWDPLSGMQGNGEAGGPDLAIPFTATAAAGATYMMSGMSPYTDLNGNGQVDTGESGNLSNFAAFSIVSTSGVITSATFADPNCIPSSPTDVDCMYLSGGMPVEMMPAATGCALPDGTTAPACVPVQIDPESVYATSISMNAVAEGLFTITTPTDTSIMRLREPTSGPVTGYIFDDGGTAKLMVALSLYLDAPDLSITLSTHDLHSKPIALVLEGPVTFLPDGRISIAAANTADVPITINTSTDIAGSSKINLLMSKGNMGLQIVSKPLRGAPP
ncbi:MAG TPA: Ig-like domain-containing protein [Kofleriaceae bacterium]|jgi:hypothetical protein